MEFFCRWLQVLFVQRAYARADGYNAQHITAHTRRCRSIRFGKFAPQRSAMSLSNQRCLLSETEIPDVQRTLQQPGEATVGLFEPAALQVSGTELRGQ